MEIGVANLVFLDLIRGKKRVLDIGCGTDGSTLFLGTHAQLDYIIGIDPVRSMIEVAKRHTSNRTLNYKIDFVICDGRCLPFKQSSFDALVSRGDAFVFLIPQKTALLGFKRVLIEGAILIIEGRQCAMEAGKNHFLWLRKDDRPHYCLLHRVF